MCQEIIYQSHLEDKTGDSFLPSIPTYIRNDLALEVLFLWMVEAVLFNISWDIIVLRSIIGDQPGQQ